MACGLGKKKRISEQQKAEGIVLGEERVVFIVAMVVNICSEIVMKRCPKHKRTCCLINIIERIHIQVREF